MFSCAASTVKMTAQEITPCLEEMLSTEIRESGTGNGNSATEALVGAISAAMDKIRAVISVRFPNKQFEYSVVTKSTASGEEIELETALGEPNICDQNIECSDDGTNCTATILLSLNIAAWQ